MSVKMRLPSGTYQSDEPDPFQILVVGDSGVGKRTLISRLIQNWHELDEKFGKKEAGEGIGTGGRDLWIEVVETSIQRRFQFLQSLPVCDVVLLVYSLVDEDSFRSVSNARSQMLQIKSRDIPIVVVANKTDAVNGDYRISRAQRHEMISLEWKCEHLETSAETDRSTMRVLQQILRHHEKTVSDSSDSQQDSCSTLEDRFQRLASFVSRQNRIK